MRSPLRSFFVASLTSSCLTALALAPTARAADDRTDAAAKAKLAVGAFDGSKADEVRSAFLDALKKSGGYEITDAEDVKPGKGIADAVKNLGVTYVVTGKVSKGYALKLKVFGADGAALDEVEIKGGALAKLKSNIEARGASSVGDVIGKPAPKSEPSPAEEKPAEESSSEEKPAESSTSPSPSAEGLSPLDITAGPRPLHRTFTFHQTLADVRPKDGYTQLPSYELPLGATLFIDLNWFPASHFTTGPAEWIGLTAGYEHGIATKSVFGETTAKPITLKNSEQDWYAGLRLRIPLGAQRLGVTGAYGQHSFELIGDDGKDGRPDPLIPDVKYSYVRIGADAMFQFGDVLAGAHVGKRIVLGTGPLKSVWFPNVKAQSLEAGVTVGYRLTGSLDLLAGFDWLRYAFDFNPNPMRNAGSLSYVAGGAVDEYLAGYLALRFRLPGAGEAAAPAAAE